MKKLTKAAQTRSSDSRVAVALASLQRVHSELAEQCGSTMIVPFD